MIIDVSTLYTATGTAKLADLPEYEARVRELVTNGDDIVLTGPGPVWLYLRIAHTLHGLARSLTYDSPVTGPVKVFDHNPL